MWWRSRPNSEIQQTWCPYFSRPAQLLRAVKPAAVFVNKKGRANVHVEHGDRKCLWLILTSLTQPQRDAAAVILPDHTRTVQPSVSQTALRNETRACARWRGRCLAAKDESEQVCKITHSQSPTRTYHFTTRSRRHCGQRRVQQRTHSSPESKTQESHSGLVPRESGAQVVWPLLSHLDDSNVLYGGLHVHYRNKSLPDFTCQAAGIQTTAFQTAVPFKANLAATTTRIDPHVRTRPSAYVRRNPSTSVPRLKKKWVGMAGRQKLNTDFISASRSIPTSLVKRFVSGTSIATTSQPRQTGHSLQSVRSTLVEQMLLRWLLLMIAISIITMLTAGGTNGRKHRKTCEKMFDLRVRDHSFDSGRSTLSQLACGKALRLVAASIAHEITKGTLDA